MKNKSYRYKCVLTRDREEMEEMQADVACFVIVLGDAGSMVYIIVPKHLSKTDLQSQLTILLTEDTIKYQKHRQN